MHREDDLLKTIIASRKTNDDGSLVIYNLTSKIDVSNPKKLAKALATVFFEKDAANWFSTSGDHIEFTPKYKVRILLSEANNKVLSAIVNDFLKDLKESEISRKFEHQIKDISTDEEKMRSVIGLAAISSFFDRPFQRKDDKIEVEDQLFTEMLGSLEIRTPSDDDLIDWENLPI